MAQARSAGLPQRAWIGSGGAGQRCGAALCVSTLGVEGCVGSPQEGVPALRQQLRQVKGAGVALQRHLHDVRGAAPGRGDGLNGVVGRRESLCGCRGTLSPKTWQQRAGLALLREAAEAEGKKPRARARAKGVFWAGRAPPDGARAPANPAQTPQHPSTAGPQPAACASSAVGPLRWPPLELCMQNATNRLVHSPPGWQPRTAGPPPPSESSQAWAAAPTPPPARVLEPQGCRQREREIGGAEWQPTCERPLALHAWDRAAGLLATQHALGLGSAWAAAAVRAGSATGAPALRPAPATGCPAQRGSLRSWWRRCLAGQGVQGKWSHGEPGKLRNAKGAFPCEKGHAERAANATPCCAPSPALPTSQPHPPDSLSVSARRRSPTSPARLSSAAGLPMAWQQDDRGSGSKHACETGWLPGWLAGVVRRVHCICNGTQPDACTGHAQPHMPNVPSNSAAPAAGAPQ